MLAARIGSTRCGGTQQSSPGSNSPAAHFKCRRVECGLHEWVPAGMRRPGRRTTVRSSHGDVCGSAPLAESWPPGAEGVGGQAAGTLLAGCLAALCGLGAWGGGALAQDILTAGLSRENPVFDAAKILPTKTRGDLNTELKQFEERTGWRLRLLTAYEGELTLTEDDIRAAWQLDSRTVVVGVDPSSPNIVAFRYLGSDVQQKLRRGFWIELQSRYGNIFYIREEGEAAAITNLTSTIEGCLTKPEGCYVVPGLPRDQFYFTLVLSIAGGLVFGFASKLEPAGWVQQPWVWTVLFSPLWIILFVSLGLGPVISRTSEPWPVLGNVAGFVGAIFLFRALPNFPPRDLDPPSDEGMV